MLDIVFSYGWEPVPIHPIRMNTRNIKLCVLMLNSIGDVIIVFTTIYLKIFQNVIVCVDDCPLRSSKWLKGLFHNIQ